MNRYLQTMIVASALAIVAATISAQTPLKGVAPGAARQAESFPNVKLTTETGAEVRFVDAVKDRVVIINFMYTECDDLCEKVTRNLKQVQKSLGPRLGKDVFIYSITLDAKNDTPPVLKKYRDDHNTQAGWHYFWGEAGDIAVLRQGLGMSPLSPELRQKLKLAPLDPTKSSERQHSGMLLVGNARTGEWQKVDALSRPDHILQIVEHMIAGSAVVRPASAVAQPGSAGGSPKTIEARAGNTWQPTPLAAVVGDVIEWKMNDNSGAGNPNFPGHGVRILNWDVVKNHVEMETVPGQLTFNAVTGRNDTESKTVGQLMLRLKIKSVPPAPTEINYNCTFHGILMSGKVTIAPAPVPPKSIEAKAGNVWQPTPLNAAVGDVIEWRMNDNSGAINPGFPGHGVRITNWDAVKDHVEVETVPGQQTFNAATGKNDTESKTVGQLLLRLKIKSVPPAPAEITYNCTFHGPFMAGKVSIAAASAPPKTIEAKAGNVWQPTPLNVAVGDVIEWRMNDNSGAINPGFPGHGVRITNWDAVKDHVEVETVPGQQTFNAATGKNDTESKTVGQLLLRLKIKSVPPAPAEITYNCTFHGPFMAGKVSIAAASANLMEAQDNEFLSKMSASMQRRLLRFVNRAYQPEDLTKSPQEMRMKSEHLPPKAHRGASDAMVGFPPNVARSLLIRRPLDGYRDVRECLPSYKESGGLASLAGVLDSIGRRQFGQWDEVVRELPPVMHGALLHTGKVLLLTDGTDTVLWDPAGPITILPGATSGLTDNLFCSGHSFLSDGRLLVVGGGGSGPVNATSMHGWIFDPVALKWSRTGNDMSFQRWYPSLVTLGREPEQVLVAAGLTPFGPAARMEIYSEATNRFELVTASGPTGDLLFPGTYPSLRTLPGGEILHVATGWGVSGSPCDQSPDGAAVEPTALFTFSSPLTGSWKTLGANHRLKGMAVTLFEPTFPSVQSLVVGGGSASQSATAATMNLATLSPTWDPAFRLLDARVHPNLVVLPDGTVFICGGREASAPTPPDGGRCELFDPRPGAMPALAEMDEMTRFRHYHSLAMLLPDGRVMAAGGAAPGGCTVSVQNTIEVFSPPNLLRGPRPVISSAARFVEHGGTIEIKTSTASAIRRVVLARPGAVTHQTDSEQRILPLSFRVTAPGTIEAIAPGGTGANPIAPRGHYMLFILDDQGVPSVSTWIFVR